MPDTPFREDEVRLPVENFCYAQEDEVFAAAARDGMTWTVHRPHTIIGYAVGNAMIIQLRLEWLEPAVRDTAEDGQPIITAAELVIEKVKP